MIKITTISNIYFIGIGGIGMSSLARHFNQKGCIVKGYDKTPSVLSKELEEEGMQIHYDDDVSLIDKNAQVVVYTPAVPSDHKELNYYRNNNYTVVKRSDLLEFLTKDSFNICVAGTHGKTTISTMVAHILRESGKGCTAFLGGISVNYNTNYWSSDNNICVVEADEYDRSFLKLNPNIATISAMDPDHLDIYGTPEAVEEAFIDFTRNIKADGLLINKFELKRSGDLLAPKRLSYSLSNEEADVYARDIKIKDGSYHYDIQTEDQLITGFELNIGGLHNVENSVVAFRAAMEAGVSSEKIRDAISSFKGVRRRFEYVVKGVNGNIFIDDYAHHPEELRALISSALELFPDKKCTIIFQPHLFSRTKDLAAEFAETLGLADRVIILPIYPARELPIAGVTSSIIFEKMNTQNKWLMEKEEVLSWLKSESKKGGGLYITAGAGDIDQIILPVKNILMRDLN